MNRYQEALHFLSLEKDCNDTKCKECSIKDICHKYTAINILQEAIEKANKYDEKETPMKPIKKDLINSYDYDEQGANKNKILQCSICGFELFNEYECIDYTFNYCCFCGTKIDWSDE